MRSTFSKAKISELFRATNSERVIQNASEIPLLEAPKMVKHHIFNVFRGNSAKSQKYRDFFKKHNIDLDSYCVEISQHRHVSEIHALKNNWTTQWKLWIDAHPDATTREVYQQAGVMMDRYGISSVPLTKYRSSKK